MENIPTKFASLKIIEISFEKFKNDKSVPRFYQRVVEPWNRLPEEVVCAWSLSNFRTKYIESRTDR